MAKLKLGSGASLEKRTTPFPYQQEAIETIRELPYAALFFEQGLGKTKIAIDLTLDWLNGNVVDTILIVTKKGLVKNWLDEFRIHSHIRPRTLSSDRTANHKAFFSSSRVFVANYEAIAVEETRIAMFAKHRSIAVILDESQKIKNPDSELTKSFFRLTRTFKKRLIMTGTPMANRPFDIWAQIYFLDEGKSLGKAFDIFRAKLDLDAAHNVDAFGDDLLAIFPAISSFSLRETKAGSGLELPGKSYATETALWEKRQKAMYDSVRQDLRLVVEKDGTTVIDDTEVLLKRLLRLVQIASNPFVVDQSYDQVPGKLPVLMSLLERIILQEEKAIVWTSFVKNCSYLRKRLSMYQAVQVNGQMSITDRNRSIERFKAEEEVKVLVATPAAAKEGLTLTVANHVIFYDRSFGLDDYLQAQDRIHRISQTKSCFVHDILMTNSIDEWISALILLKSSAARVGMGDADINELRESTSVDLKEILNAVLHG